MVAAVDIGADVFCIKAHFIIYCFKPQLCSRKYNSCFLATSQIDKLIRKSYETLIFTCSCLDWLIAMRLVSRSGLWKRILLKCFITLVFNIPLLTWCKISSPSRENNNVVFPFLFHIFKPLATCGSSAFRIVSHPNDKKFLWPLPAHPPSRRPLALDRGRILIPIFIRPPPTLAA